MIARSLVCYLLSFGFIALIVFLNFPQTDISIANYFWNSGWHDKTGWYGLVYYGVYWLSPIIVVALLSLLVYLYLTSSKKFKKCTIFFLLTCILLGPGLVVNGIFKDHWGRARPSQITEFNGKESFVLPFVISQACHKNCSFVSGHASFGFVLFALAYVFQRRRYLIAFSSFTLGWIIGYVRMAQGGHFFSDVLYSWLITWFVIHITYIIYQKLGYHVKHIKTL